MIIDIGGTMISRLLLFSSNQSTVSEWVIEEIFSQFSLDCDPKHLKVVCSSWEAHRRKQERMENNDNL